jgi:hypothetical protein
VQKKSAVGNIVASFMRKNRKAIHEMKWEAQDQKLRQDVYGGMPCLYPLNRAGALSVCLKSEWEAVFGTTRPFPGLHVSEKEIDAIICGALEELLEYNGNRNDGDMESDDGRSEDEVDGSGVDWEERELRDSDDEDGGGVGVKRKHEMSESAAKEGASIDQNESEGDIHDATDQDGESDEGGLQGIMKRKLDGADLDFLPLDRRKMAKVGKSFPQYGALDTQRKTSTPFERTQEVLTEQAERKANGEAQERFFPLDRRRNLVSQQDKENQPTALNKLHEALHRQAECRINPSIISMRQDSPAESYHPPVYDPYNPLLRLNKHPIHISQSMYDPPFPSLVKGKPPVYSGHPDECANRVAVSTYVPPMVTSSPSAHTLFLSQHDASP